MVEVTMVDKGRIVRHLGSGGCRGAQRAGFPCCEILKPIWQPVPGLSELAGIWPSAGARHLLFCRTCLRPPAGRPGAALLVAGKPGRSAEHTSELQSLMRISYAVFCLK